MKPPEDVAWRLSRDWLAKDATDLLVCERLLVEGAAFSEAVACHAQQAAATTPGVAADQRVISAGYPGHGASPQRLTGRHDSAKASIRWLESSSSSVLITQ
jgi:hypothetical protein